MTCLPLLVAALASAEPVEPGLSTVEITHDGFAITVARDEFADRMPTDNIEAADRLLEALLIDATWISVDGNACRVGNSQMRVVEEGAAVEIAAPILCGEGDLWRYHATWLRGREAGHRHLVTAFGESIGVLTPEADTLDLVPAPDRRLPPIVLVGAAAGAGLFAMTGGLVLFWLGRLRS